MARVPFVLILMMFLIAAAASAQKVYIDHDPSYDGSGVKTFAWAKSPETSMAESNGLMHSRIVNAIEHFLSQGGLREVESDPDVYVTYHTNSKEELSVNTDNFGYGYPGGWAWDPYWPGYYGGGWGSTTTTVSQYTRGTLIVDVWDAKAKKLVWRGSASAIVPDKPAKLEKKIYKAIEKMVAKWQKIKDKEGL